MVGRARNRKQREQQSALLAEWKEAEEARKQWNKEQKVAYQEQLALWMEEKKQAKQEKWQVEWKKPTMGKLERPLSKPACGRAEIEGDEGDGEHSDVDELVQVVNSADKPSPHNSSKMHLILGKTLWTC